MIPVASNTDSRFASSNGDAINYRIVANATAFKVLSSQIYRRKHEAVVREIACNAADAHAEVGTPDRPVHVQLPNSFEPHLVIRDFGPGLSPDRVEQVYTVYFASDKSESNLYTGYLGLGAKSPFSVTDHFHVTSWHQGIKYVFLVTHRDDGMCAIPEHAEESDEPSGVEVKIACVRKDFDAYATAAARALAYFRVRPVVTGVADFTPATPEYKTRTETYGLHGGASHVVMSDVGYEIDAEAVGLKYEYVYGKQPGLDDVENGARNLLRAGIDLFLPIGAVEPDAGREGLSYKPATITAVREAAFAAVRDVVARATDEVAKADCFWEVNKAARRQRNLLASVGGAEGFDWRGRFATGAIETRKHGLVSVLGWGEGSRYERGSYNKKVVWLRDDKVTTVRCKDDVLAVVVDDDTPGRYAAAKRYVGEDARTGSVIMVRQDQVDSGVLDTLGWNGPVVKVSEIPKPAPAPRVKGQKAAKVRCKLARFDYNAFNATVDVDPTLGGVYVEVLRNKVVWNGTPQDCDHVRNRLSTFETMGYPVPTLYGVIPSELAWLKKKGDWVHLHDVARASVKKAAKKHLYGATLIAADKDWYYQFHKLFKSKFDDGCAFGAYAKLAAKCYAARNDRATQAFITLNDAYGALLEDVVKVEPDKEYEEAQDLVHARYPMLFLIDRVHDTSVDDALKYVKLVDDALEADLARTTVTRNRLKLGS